MPFQRGRALLSLDLIFLSGPRPGLLQLDTLGKMKFGGRSGPGKRDDLGQVDGLSGVFGDRPGAQGYLAADYLHPSALTRAR